VDRERFSDRSVGRKREGNRVALAASGKKKMAHALLPINDGPGEKRARADENCWGEEQRLRLLVEGHEEWLA